MAKRSRDWNEGLARDLQNPAFAREFLVAAIHEGIPLQRALGKVIRAAGVKEFAARAGVASPNVLRAINPRHNPTQETINRLLRPLGLRLSLALIEERGARRRPERPVKSIYPIDEKLLAALADGQQVRPKRQAGRGPGKHRQVLRVVGSSRPVSA